MNEIMPIHGMDDWERRLDRMDAFWDREVIDRPPAAIIIEKPEAAAREPAGGRWDELRERWLDVDFRSDYALATVDRHDYLGDALPKAIPNLGPEVFSAFFGTPLEFGERTSWSVPNLKDWDRADDLQFSEDNVYWRAIMDLTDALLEKGRYRCYTGMTDLHPGGDALAAFRDPATLAMDLIDHREEVAALLDRVTRVYLRLYDVFYEKLRAAQQPTCTWHKLVSRRKWYLPSNDFSCMISKEMFDDIFLPGIVQECRHLQAALYHLDGPGALRHLDSLLAVPELNGIQWVCGSGNGRASDWYEVYHKCQAAGKVISVPLQVDELEAFMDAFKPGGVFLNMSNVRDREEAERVLKRLTTWT